VGYFSYDIIRYIEKVPDKCSDDLKIPDIRLLRPKTIIIHDNLLKKIYFIVNCFADEKINNYLNDYDNPDFILQNTVGTFVLRWEYRSGSTVFIVYNLNDNKYYSPVDKAWTSEEANALYFKLNYWIKN